MLTMFNLTVSTTDKFLTVVNDNQYDIKNDYLLTSMY